MIIGTITDKIYINNFIPDISLGEKKNHLTLAKGKQIHSWEV